MHGLDRLAQAVLGQRRVRDVEDEVGDERLLERRREALDELGRQPADESDRVGHEVALPVVGERARRRVERLEQPVVDRRVRARQRIQQRRLADVRVPGEGDRRDARPLALLPARRALAAQAPQAALDERHARSRQPAVGLELALPRPAGADAAAEPLEVLPHAAHAREVVLELRQLDLELALGASRVLGEDVEDQLRAVDDARLERVLERPLLRRPQLLVHEQHLGGGLAYALCSSVSFPFPTNVRGSGCARCCTSSPTVSTPAVRASSRSSSSSPSPSTPFGKTPTTNPRSGSAPGAGSGWRAVTTGLWPRYAPAVNGLADRLAQRTLELVDIPSESRDEERVREHLLELVPAGWPRSTRGDEAYLFVPRDAATRRSCVLAGHYDTVPAQDNLPGGSPTAQCTGSARAT